MFSVKRRESIQESQSSTFKDMFSYMFSYMYVCMYVCMYVFMYVCKYSGTSGGQQPSIMDNLVIVDTFSVPNKSPLIHYVMLPLYCGQLGNVDISYNIYYLQRI